MDNRVTGLLDLAEALKNNPPATTYPDHPLEVRLSYPTRDAALNAAGSYGATVLMSTRFAVWAQRGFAHEQGNYFPGARLVVMWSAK